MARKKKRMWLCIGIPALIVALIITACVLVGNFFYNFALLRKPADGQSPAVAADGEAENPALGNFGAAFDVDPDWAASVGAQDVALTSDDGLRLHGYFIEAPDTDTYVILCHGYHSEAEGMLVFAKKFYELGYGALLPDARGHGQSEGDYVGMGWHERKDVTNWAVWLSEKKPEAQIVLFGISMGGATVMMTSGQELPDSVAAVIEDCGYSSIRAEFAYQLKAMFRLPSFPALNLAGMTAGVRAGYNFMHEGDAAKEVAKCTRPILFIHGGDDRFVPTDMVYTVYDAATCDKELLIVEGAGRGLSFAVDPVLYWDTVTAFLERTVDQ